MGGPFRYAGVENGDACYCGNTDDKFMPTDPKECNIPCTGDPGQFCGSSWRLQVYDTEYTEGQMTTSQLETTKSPTTNAILILSTANSNNVPIIVDFDGQ